MEVSKHSGQSTIADCSPLNFTRSHETCRKSAGCVNGRFPSSVAKHDARAARPSHARNAVTNRTMPVEMRPARDATTAEAAATRFQIWESKQSLSHFQEMAAGMLAARPAKRIRTPLDMSAHAVGGLFG
ncbi:unnamed protein product [Polarella glacialis]|uniref:Uncharacterized protein n=1 Tax=Polarella glacialis TaxID=89957 RepID=A0A813JZU2_POLGL|nr:unnamed protein product [Polarella glacialis]CAE8693247.1 unnamed protein product [Polarella glacialis]